MQTSPATGPSPASQAATYLQSLPDWLQLSLGFLLIGIGASILASQLRAAFPSTDGNKRALHYLYAPFFGASFATFAPFTLPGFGYDSRWLIGLVAPFLWSPFYELLKKRYETQLGVKLPDAGAMVQPGGRSTPPKEGQPS